MTEKVNCSIFILFRYKYYELGGVQMKLSTKGRYGLRAMVDLAFHSKGELVPLKNISERQNISDAYLEQVFSTLRKAGLVKSHKGSQGGYLLGHPMAKITVGQILRALEGELFPYEAGEYDNKIEILLTNDVWKVIDESINVIVDQITLEDLVITYEKSLTDSIPMFFI